MDGMRQALGMSRLLSIIFMLTDAPSYDARHDKRNEPDEASVLTYLRDGCRRC
jgi:hypothetical protein